MACWRVEAWSMWTLASWKPAMMTAGEVVVVFDEEDVGGAVAGVEDAAEFGEEEILVEGLLHPALGGAGDAVAGGGSEGGGRRG